jgi:hypothetical protein
MKITRALALATSLVAVLVSMTASHASTTLSIRMTGCVNGSWDFFTVPAATLRPWVPNSYALETVADAPDDATELANVTAGTALGTLYVQSDTCMVSLNGSEPTRTTSSVIAAKVGPPSFESDPRPADRFAGRYAPYDEWFYTLGVMSDNATLNAALGDAGFPVNAGTVSHVSSHEGSLTTLVTSAASTGAWRYTVAGDFCDQATAEEISTPCSHAAPHHHISMFYRDVPGGTARLQLDGVIDDRQSRTCEISGGDEVRSVVIVEPNIDVTCFLTATYEDGVVGAISTIAR